MSQQKLVRQVLKVRSLLGNRPSEFYFFFLLDKQHKKKEINPLTLNPPFTKIMSLMLPLYCDNSKIIVALKSLRNFVAVDIFAIFCDTPLVFWFSLVKCTKLGCHSTFVIV